MNLKKLREEKNLTQNEMAQILNVNQSNYSKYEKNIIEPNLDTLKKIADFYGVSLDYLCEHETKNLLDTSNYNEYKKGVIYALGQLNEKNDLILLGYITHMLAEQMKEDK